MPKLNSMPNRQHRHQQRGVVMILFGLSIAVLIGFLALVIDLGRTYVVRTELQNAADAAALAGAKALNQTADGVCGGNTCKIGSAVDLAIKMAAQNNFKFSSPVVITIANISVGNCPEDSCMVDASSVGKNDARADGKNFLKVNIPSGGLTAFFGGLVGATSTSTYGNAVAGKYLVDITPMAICKLANNTDFGYEIGVSYKVSDVNPIAPGVSYWIDPVATTAAGCSGNVPATLPYVCAGKLAFTPTIGQTVYTNTGVSDPQLEAIDSRFDVFNNKNNCDATTAPPDTNIKQYDWGAPPSDQGAPRVWMKTTVPIQPPPTQRSLTFQTTAGVYGPKPIGSRSFYDYGVLWSASRPVGTTVGNWPSLYGGTLTNEANYPETSPYAKTSGVFWAAPSNPGKSGRRMMRLLIVDCPSSGGNCRPATVRGVGKFFLQKKANGSSDKEVYVEYSGLESTPLANADIRLYR